MPRLHWPKHHPWVWLVVLASVVETLIVGLGLALGPAAWASSEQYGPLQRLVDRLPGDDGSMRAWGWAFLLSGVLLIVGSFKDARILRAGFVLAASIAAMWACGFASTLRGDELVGIGGIGSWAFVAIIQSAAAAGDGEAFRWVPWRGR